MIKIKILSFLLMASLFFSFGADRVLAIDPFCDGCNKVFSFKLKPGRNNCSDFDLIPVCGKQKSFASLYYECKCVSSGILLPDNPAGFKFNNLGEIVSSALTYVYVFAGLGLLVMLIVGGISLMTAAGDEAKVKSGYGKISGALIGFFIIFLTYTVAQLVEKILGVSILN